MGQRGLGMEGGGCRPVHATSNELWDIHPNCQAIEQGDPVEMDTERQKKLIECRAKL